MVTATVDLDEVVSYRGAKSSLREQASSAKRLVIPIPQYPEDVQFAFNRSTSGACVHTIS